MYLPFDTVIGRIRKSAEISACGRYRWWLRRSWNGGDERVICFIMLNPSTADAETDDPTIRRCIRFAQRWGFSHLSVRNLFALRATNPDDLWRADDPIGGARGDHELAAAATADVVVAAWGVNVIRSRDEAALRLLRGVRLMCLGKTKSGQPQHPLYVRANQPLVEFAANIA